MSARPVPTSTIVAPSSRLGRISSKVAVAARSPPRSLFERVTSVIDRARMAGSIVGSSSSSMPRRRRGVSKASACQLSIAAAIVHERPAIGRLRRRAIDLGDENRVIAAFVVLDDPTLHVGQCRVEQDDVAFAARKGDAVESVVLIGGEATGVWLLLR